jgi:hypothetical protein
MSARCNRKVDCDDKSDELNCFNGYLTRKIRGSLRISNPLSVHSRRSIKHTKKALIAGKHKPKQNQWELHSSQCRSVSSTSYFKLFNNFFSNLAGDTTQNKFNPTIASFSSASVPTHWSFILLLATCIVTASCPAAHTNSTKFCPLFIFNCLAKPQKGDILHAQMVQYLHAPNHTSPWTRPVWEYLSHSPARKHMAFFYWTDFRFLFTRGGKQLGLRSFDPLCFQVAKKSIEDVLDCKCLQSGTNGPLQVILHPSTRHGAIGISISWKNQSSFLNCWNVCPWRK